VGKKDSTGGGTSSFLEAQAYWDGDSINGRSAMVLDLTQQMIFYYKGGQLVGIAPACTGKEGHSTPTGTFRVTQKDTHHMSTLYGDFVNVDGKVVVANISSRHISPYGSTFRGASMPFFMRLYGRIGIHGGFLPGVPDSHGCIRIPNKMAEIFFQNTPLGTPVSIVHKLLYDHEREKPPTYKEKRTYKGDL
jgi:lipoprotein-anchoring transpeptidase ErfK/SrfK